MYLQKLMWKRLVVQIVSSKTLDLKHKINMDVTYSLQKAVESDRAGKALSITVFSSSVQFLY